MQRLISDNQLSMLLPNNTQKSPSQVRMNTTLPHIQKINISQVKYARFDFGNVGMRIKLSVDFSKSQHTTGPPWALEVFSCQ
jgi:hypothetical protein